jgi:lipopolysaccharide biosynthesis glycosyltransferase
MITVYIGFDSNQKEAFNVCKYSIKKNSNESIKIFPLMKDFLINSDLYYRNEDSNASTEFAFTRFLVPYLNDYQGWAIFCDSDFLWTGDVNELFKNLNQDIAVKCVKHNYEPKSNQKMEGKIQTKYPRKNWSSMMVFNCSHPSCKKLTIENINTRSGAWLHRFQWCDDKEIEEVGPEYNCLVGYYNIKQPKAIHFTDGGPWHKGYENVEFADLWKQYLRDYIEKII